MVRPEAGEIDLAAAAPCGLVRVEAGGLVTDANPLLLDWLGKTAAEVLHRLRMDDLLSAGAGLYYRTMVLPRLRINGRVEEVSLTLAGPEAREVLLTGTLDPATGAATFAVFAAEARRRFEREQSAALAAVSARAGWLDQIEALSGLGAWSISLPDEVLRWSDRVFVLHDLPPGDTPSVAEALAFIDGEGDRDRLARDMNRAVARGKGFASEVRIVTARGQNRVLRISGEPFWEKGKVIQVLGIAQDITAQREAEAARDRAEAQMAKLAENLPGALIGVEMEGDGPLTISFLSAGAEAIWGAPAATLMQDPGLIDRGAPDGTPSGLMGALRAGLDSGEPVNGRFRVVPLHGRPRWLTLRGSITREAPGRRRADCIMLDITPQVEAQAELERQTAMAQQSQKFESIGQLTGGVAHDFNNLLAAILGNLELLRETCPVPEDLELIDAAIKATERGAGLTRSMLAFSQKARLDPEICDLNALVRETSAWAGRTLPATIRVTLRQSAALWPVRVDINTTASALLNLLLNARDAMPEGGELVIETENAEIDAARAARLDGLAPGRFVVLSVADTGTGIAETALPHVFEPFFTTKGPGRGSGLGLSMVQGFLRQSGGTVEVRSRPGEGAVFRLYFPATTGSVAEPVPPAALPVERPQARILLAEDEPQVMAVLRRILEKAGYAVSHAGSGDLALEIFARDPRHDLLLTDVVMPGRLQGPALAAELRALRPDLPVVFLTGYAAETALGHGGIREGDLRLMKPVSRAELLRAIERALGLTGGLAAMP